MRAFAPGRVNLIGEHTDYNEGLCLPFAVERGVTVRVEPLAGGTAHQARALDLGEVEWLDASAPPAAPAARPAAGPAGRDAGASSGAAAAGPESSAPPAAPARHGAGARGGDPWRLYVRGVLAELAASGLEPPPSLIEIRGDLPRGAGLSSSAALCVALALALRAAAGASAAERVELARLCSRVENVWVGARTGLLDQLASLFAERGHALRIDMRGPLVERVPLELGCHTLATIGSGAPRSLAASRYNERRAECEAARERLGLASLRDARGADARRLPEPLAARVRHVTGENARVDAMVAALARRDLEAAGRLLDASHASLRDDFEASVPAVERAVERARAAGALGARMVGGGFGGQLLALFPRAARLPDGARPVSPGPGAAIC